MTERVYVRFGEGNEIRCYDYDEAIELIKSAREYHDLMDGFLAKEAREIFQMFEKLKENEELSKDELK